MNVVRTYPINVKIALRMSGLCLLSSHAKLLGNKMEYRSENCTVITDINCVLCSDTKIYTTIEILLYTIYNFGQFDMNFKLLV